MIFLSDTLKFTENVTFKYSVSFFFSKVSELRAKLAAQKDHNASVKKMLDDAENEKRRLELQILNLKEDLDIS